MTWIDKFQDSFALWRDKIFAHTFVLSVILNEAHRASPLSALVSKYALSIELQIDIACTILSRSTQKSYFSDCRWYGCVYFAGRSRNFFRRPDNGCRRRTSAPWTARCCGKCRRTCRWVVVRDSRTKLGIKDRNSRGRTARLRKRICRYYREAETVLSGDSTPSKSR